MIECSFEDFKRKLNYLIDKGFEPELSLYLHGKEYMIIAYGDHCSFQRCGVRDGSGEYKYSTLDELYLTKSVDGIVLKDEWPNISDWECFEIECLGLFQDEKG